MFYKKTECYWILAVDKSIFSDDDGRDSEWKMFVIEQCVTNTSYVCVFIGLVTWTEIASSNLLP